MVLQPNVTTVTLDAQDLTIHKVFVDKLENTKWSLNDPWNKKESFGEELKINLPFIHKVGQVIRVEIFYNTSAKSKALSWLDGKMTGTGKPFLFSQSEMIMARCIFPCQDTPKIKFVYRAEVTC